MRYSILMITALGTSLAWAGTPGAGPSPSPSPTTVPSSHPAIVHLVSRDETLTIRSGRHQLLYSLVRADGAVLLAETGVERLAKLHPQLHQRLRNTIADADHPAWAGCE